MAIFPELEPATRSYTFGAFPLTEVPSASAGIIRFRHASIAADYQLTLGYQYLTNAEATLIRTHYGVQGGSNISFALPAIIWKGHASTMDVMQWRYASPPEEEHFSAGYVNLQVSLVSDGLISRSLGTVTASLVSGAAGGGVSGAALTMTASLAEGAAGGGAAGADLSVTASLVEGTATGA